MDREDIRLLLDIQSKAYNDALKSFMRELSLTQKQTEAMVRDLRKSLEFSQGEVDDLRKTLAEQEKQRKSDEMTIRNLMQEIAELRDEQKITKEAVNRLDDHSRRRNVKIGLPEVPGENPEQT